MIVATGLPWEIVAWRQRRRGRRVERSADGAVVLVESLPATNTRFKLDTTEVRRTYPTLTAACAAVAL